jgi:hypothetical protein
MAAIAPSAVDRAPLLQVENLTKHFDVSPPWLTRLLQRTGNAIVRAVDGVSFEIARGRTSAWSANRAAASRPWRAWWSASTGRQAARSGSMASR